MARTSSTGDTPPVENPEPVVQAMDVAMQATSPDEGVTSTDPPGSDELTAENVRRYPHLFTDEQKATIGSDELPLSDIEKEQAAAAEAEQNAT